MPTTSVDNILARMLQIMLATANDYRVDNIAIDATICQQRLLLALIVDQLEIDQCIAWVGH